MLLHAHAQAHARRVAHMCRPRRAYTAMRSSLSPPSSSLSRPSTSAAAASSSSSTLTIPVSSSARASAALPGRSASSPSTAPTRATISAAPTSPLSSTTLTPSSFLALLCSTAPLHIKLSSFLYMVYRSPSVPLLYWHMMIRYLAPDPMRAHTSAAGAAPPPPHAPGAGASSTTSPTPTTTSFDALSFAPVSSTLHLASPTASRVHLHAVLLLYNELVGNRRRLAFPLPNATTFTLVLSCFAHSSPRYGLPLMYALYDTMRTGRYAPLPSPPILDPQSYELVTFLRHLTQQPHAGAAEEGGQDPLTAATADAAGVAAEAASPVAHLQHPFESSDPLLLTAFLNAHTHAVMLHLARRSLRSSTSSTFESARPARSVSSPSSSAFSSSPSSSTSSPPPRTPWLDATRFSFDAHVGLNLESHIVMSELYFDRLCTVLREQSSLLRSPALQSSTSHVTARATQSATTATLKSRAASHACTTSAADELSSASAPTPSSSTSGGGSAATSGNNGGGAEVGRADAGITTTAAAGGNLRDKQHMLHVLYAFEAMMLMYTELGRRDAWTRVYAQLLECGALPSVSLYMTMLHCLQRFGDARAMHECGRSMLESGLPLASAHLQTLAATLLPVYMEHERYDDAARLVVELDRRHVRVRAALYPHLLTLLARRGKWDDLDAWYRRYVAALNSSAGASQSTQSTPSAASSSSSSAQSVSQSAALASAYALGYARFAPAHVLHERLVPWLKTYVAAAAGTAGAVAGAGAATASTSSSSLRTLTDRLPAALAANPHLGSSPKQQHHQHPQYHPQHLPSDPSASPLDAAAPAAAAVLAIDALLAVIARRH